MSENTYFLEAELHQERKLIQKEARSKCEDTVNRSENYSLLGLNKYLL